MRLFADECVDRRLVERLRAAGHEVVEITALQPGIGDTDVLAAGRRLGLVLLTRDKDFGELVVRRVTVSSGVLLLRLRLGDLDLAAGRVLAVIDGQGDRLLHSLVIIDRDRTRVIELARGP